MRKIFAIGLILVMVVIGFAAMLNPVASCECEDVTIEKEGIPVCYFGGLPVSQWDNDNVPLNTFVTWFLKIEVTNNHDYTIEDVVVKDRLGGELMLMDWDPDDGDVPPDIDPRTITQGSWGYSLHGKTDKVFLEWDVGDILPYHTATFIIGIGTDINPGGQQEYTTPGEYYLNSGATVKWIDPTDGKQYSASSNRIMITVIGEEEE